MVEFCRLLMLFQLAPPRGGRLAAVDNAHTLQAVSTRAPAWGATWLASLLTGWGIRFQLAPPRGGRLSQNHLAVTEQVFQLAPPRGGRPRAQA